MTIREQNTRKKLITSLLLIVIISALVMATDDVKSKRSIAAASQITDSSTPSTPVTSTPNPTPPPTPSAATTAPPTTPAAATPAPPAQSGTYSARSSYRVPGSIESIKVTLAVSNGVITNVSIVNSEGDNNSAQYQQDFTSAYKSSVVGKKLSGLQLDVISGASDTTQGFNDALSQIASKV
jgi:uncharacterized protein with FMN-binding domain